MLDKREIKGIWFLPDSRDMATTGTLTYVPGEMISLELIGDLQERSSFADYLEGIGSPSVIHGKTTMGTDITLFNCRGSGSIRTDAIPITRYSVESFLEGRYMTDLDEKAFTELETDFPQLLRWLGHSGYVMEREKVSERFYRTNIRYSPDEIFEQGYQVEQGLEFRLRVTAQAKNNFEVCHVENHASATIVSNETQLSIWDLVNKIQIFRTFLSLGLYQNIPYRFIRVKMSDTGKQATFTFLERGEKYETKNQAFLFNFMRLEPFLGDILRSWYDQTGDMFPIRRHLLDAVLPRTTFSSTDFLVLTFAVEGFYHRFLKRNPGNSGNLKSAITDILRIFKDLPFIKTVSVKPDQVNDSRNYYAHLYRKTNEQSILSGAKLLQLSEKLKMLLILSILKQMGLDEEKITECIQHSTLLETSFLEEPIS